jgi:hypothetical protein
MARNLKFGVSFLGFLCGFVLFRGSSTFLSVGFKELFKGF